jgi:hypothetical protein
VRCPKTWEFDTARNPVNGSQFRRDVKLAQKRGEDTVKFRDVILLLIEGIGFHVDPEQEPIQFDGAVAVGLPSAA